MLTPYLLVFDNMGLARKYVEGMLTRCPEVAAWMPVLPNTLVLASEYDAFVIQAAFHTKFPGVRHIVTEVAEGNNDGRFDQVVWDFINDPENYLN